MGFDVGGAVGFVVEDLEIGLVREGEGGRYGRVIRGRRLVRRISPRLSGWMRAPARLL